MLIERMLSAIAVLAALYLLAGAVVFRDLRRLGLHFSTAVKLTVACLAVMAVAAIVVPTFLSAIAHVFEQAWGLASLNAPTVAASVVLGVVLVPNLVHATLDDDHYRRWKLLYRRR